MRNTHYQTKLLSMTESDPYAQVKFIYFLYLEILLSAFHLKSTSCVSAQYKYNVQQR